MGLGSYWLIFITPFLVQKVPPSALLGIPTGKDFSPSLLRRSLMCVGYIQKDASGDADFTSVERAGEGACLEPPFPCAPANGF